MVIRTIKIWKCVRSQASLKKLGLSDGSTCAPPHVKKGASNRPLVQVPSGQHAQPLLHILGSPIKTAGSQHFLALPSATKHAKSKKMLDMIINVSKCKCLKKKKNYLCKNVKPVD